jgi:hypothetical protein
MFGGCKSDDSSDSTDTSDVSNQSMLFGENEYIARLFLENRI